MLSANKILRFVRLRFRRLLMKVESVAGLTGYAFVAGLFIFVASIAWPYWLYCYSKKKWWGIQDSNL